MISVLPSKPEGRCTQGKYHMPIGVMWPQVKKLREARRGARIRSFQREYGPADILIVDFSLMNLKRKRTEIKQRRNCSAKRNWNLKVWKILSLSVLQKNEKACSKENTKGVAG